MPREFNAFTIARCCPPAIALIALLTGCGAPSWDQFDQIQLARPLPTPLPGGMERTILGAGYIGAPGGPGSFFASDMRIANALTDANGSAIARSCLTAAISHRLIYVQTIFRYVIEVNLGEVTLGGAGMARAVPEELQLVASVSQKLTGRVVRDSHLLAFRLVDAT